MPQRQAQLQHWLREPCGFAEFTIEPASGDASFRRYFRVGLPDGRSLIAMDAPPEREDCGPFVEVTGRLAAAGVHVPQILAQDLRQGFLLLEDLGDRLYLSMLNEQTVAQLYADAMAAMLRYQQHGQVEGLPPYDRGLLLREMGLFPDWLLERHLGLELSQAEQALLADSFDRLVESALAQPRVLVHRDYHSRNLLVCRPDNPGIIDYQDAVHGPISYDLVSLLRDCYIRWPPGQVDAWVQDYAQRAQQAGLLSGAQRASFTEWFDLMGVQRHLKAAGIFARLKHRDGKPGYLGDIPRTLGYIVEVAERRPAVAALGAFIRTRVLPGLASA